MPTQPSRRERWKARVLKTPTLSHGTRLFLVHNLAKHMKADGFISRPRWKLAADAGVSERQVTRYMSNAVAAGWLVTIQVGYRSMTAEYQATFPDTQSGTQDVPHSKPIKRDVNKPSLGVTNTSRIHGRKRDVGRPTTSSTTTRPFEVGSHTPHVRRSPTPSSTRFGFGINESEHAHRTTCRTRPKPVERHRTHVLVAALVEIPASGTDPATRFVCLKARPHRKAQRRAASQKASPR